MADRAVIFHGRFDKKSEPNSDLEKMADALRSQGYEVLTLNCDDLLPKEWVSSSQIDDRNVFVGYSNGAEEVCDVLRDLNDKTLIVCDLLILFDPVDKSMFDQIIQKCDIAIPPNVRRCITYLRGDKYPQVTNVGAVETFVPLLTNSLFDHGRVPGVAMPDAMAMIANLDKKTGLAAPGAAILA